MVQRVFRMGFVLGMLVGLCTACDIQPQRWLGPLVGPKVPVATIAVGEPTPVPAPLPTVAVVRGRITDLSGRPIPNATVAVAIKTPGVPLAPVPITTTAQGTYTSQDLEPGAYEFTVNVPGYKPQTKRVEVLAGQEVPLDFVLEPEG